MHPVSKVSKTSAFTAGGGSQVSLLRSRTRPKKPCAGRWLTMAPQSSGRWSIRMNRPCPATSARTSSKHSVKPCLRARQGLPKERQQRRPVPPEMALPRRSHLHALVRSATPTGQPRSLGSCCWSESRTRAIQRRGKDPALACSIARSRRKCRRNRLPLPPPAGTPVQTMIVPASQVRRQGVALN